MTFPIGTISCPWAHSKIMRLRIALGLLWSVLSATALCLNGRSFFLTNLQTGLVGYVPAIVVVTLMLLFMVSKPSITLRHSINLRKIQAVIGNAQVWLRKPQVRAAVLVLCITVMLICATGYWWQPMVTHDMVDP